jgi:trans-aconitate methyltransferase
VEWDPEQYVRGNYFQNKVSDVFRRGFNVEPCGNILDIGCGDGQYSSVLATHIKHGQILGIDSSADMVKHANQHWARENLSFEVQSIDAFQSHILFDFVLSFWCLHWTNIHKSLPNIFHALKPGGRVYAVFSSFSDNSILHAWQELAKQNRYRELTKQYVRNKNQDQNYFYRVVNILNQLPFKQVKINLKITRIYLPRIDYFENLLRIMPFTKAFPKVIVEALIHDLLNLFQTSCQQKYGGKLYYETRPIFLEAIK